MYDTPCLLKRTSCLQLAFISPLLCCEVAIHYHKFAVRRTILSFVLPVFTFVCAFAHYCGYCSIMICLMMYVRPLLSTHSEGSSKPISLHKHIHPNFCSPWSLSMVLTLAMSQVYDYSFLLLFGAPRVCL